jgi:large subunit ribosomal protein L10
VGYKGMTVAQLHDLRVQLRPQGGKLQVAKARLMKKALEEVAGTHDMDGYLKDQIGLVFVTGEAPAVAKVLCNYAKENSALSLIAGRVDAHVFDKNGVEQFATIPSIDVLRAQICGAIKAPMSRLAQVLHTSVSRVVCVINEVQKKQA